MKLIKKWLADRAQRSVQGFAQLGEHAVDDHARRYRQAAVVQDRAQLRLFDLRFERQQALEPRIAILLDDEQHGVRGEEFLYFVPEREAAHAHVVELRAAPFQDIERLAHRTVAAAERNDADIVRAAPRERGF